ncbi:hypothetical protein LSH36_241g02025 [Paralvinella palmiformis]|uniref:C-type lectin domain-containing protein n=1 Tax=Paralvinella palmiformis TaxID=53620 RepID=A0AAD9JMW3_9ANNE|nr:hypothetical protein LSH36_241g02025 [Paralvinella palmiformis]
MTQGEAESRCRSIGAELFISRRANILSDPETMWLSARRRSWLHGTLDLALTYEFRNTNETEDACIALDPDFYPKYLLSGKCSETFFALCMKEELGKIQILLANICTIYSYCSTIQLNDHHISE